MTIFFIVSLFILLCAIMVIYTRKVMHSVFFMILSMFGVAGHFFLLGATFLGVIQIIVYSGAIMILFIFVVMLLDLRDLKELDEHTLTMRKQRRRRQMIRTGSWGLVTILFLGTSFWLHRERQTLPISSQRAEKTGLASFFPVANRPLDIAKKSVTADSADSTRPTDSTRSTDSTAKKKERKEIDGIAALSLALFGKFVLPFELISVLFLSAMVGTILLVSKSD